MDRSLWMFHFSRNLRLFFASAFLVPFGTVFAFTQQPLKTLLVDVDHRPSISLDGEWHYLVDSTGRSLYDASGRIRNDGYALNEHPALTSEYKGQEYDFATAPVLKVPGDWNTQDPTLFRYEGVLWYERDFDYQPKPYTRTFLHIGAARRCNWRWRRCARLG